MLRLTLLLVLLSGCQLARENRVEVHGGKCITCHLDAFEGIEFPSHEELFAAPEDCGHCHQTTHWLPASYPEHAWPLIGQHQEAWCEDCHSDEPVIWDGLVDQCIDCHDEDYDPPPFDRHMDFPDTCEQCHSPVAWTPGGIHNESGFPITHGHHDEYRNECGSCHNTELGRPFDGANTDCVGCHDGEHERRDMDKIHDGFRDYPTGDAPPNFCRRCHSRG